MRLNKNKKAYTIIEVIISIAITILLLPVIINIFLSSISEFKKYSQYSIDLNDFDSALLNIDELVRANGITDIASNRDTIIISMQQNLKSGLKVRKDIYLRGNRLIVETFDDSRHEQFTSRAKNTLIRGVKNFEVIKKGNLTYYSVELENGMKRIKCL